MQIAGECSSAIALQKLAVLQRQDGLRVSDSRKKPIRTVKPGVLVLFILILAGFISICKMLVKCDF